MAAEAPLLDLIDFTLHSSDNAITPSEVFKVGFYQLCDCFKNFYHIYTDGSKMGHRVSAALCHKRGTSSIRLPGATSIFNAELHAVLLARDVVRRSKEKDFLLLSDSYSSLIALGGSHVDHDTVYKYLKTYSTLTNSGKTVILCLIPGHVGIRGNERADRVAKAVLSLPISPVKVSAMDFPRAKLFMRKEWQEIWNCCESLLIPQWVLPNGMILSVGEMPSFSIGYRLVTRVLYTHIFLVTTKQSVGRFKLY